jgi:hypothetical protein
MTNPFNPEYTLVRGGRNVVRWLRRLATRILLVQVHAELSELRERQDRLERQLHALLGRHYDQLAANQRLAALEDCVREWSMSGDAAEEYHAPKKG